MKNNKQERVRQRLRWLTLAAIILGLLTVVTGYFCFLPASVKEDLPGAPPQSEVLPEPPSLPMEAAPPEPAEDVAPSQPPAPETEPKVADTLPPEMQAPPEPNPAENIPGAIEEFFPTKVAPNDGAVIPTPPQQDDGIRLFLRIACGIFFTATLLVILLLVILRRNIQQYEARHSRPKAFPPTRLSPIPLTWRRGERPVYPVPGISLGKLHDVGCRDYQQDSFGHIPVLDDTGLLAVLANGMGGLSGGERVSQKIVMEALNFGAAMTAEALPQALPNLVATVNTAVNRMLGPEGLYTSGSTVVAALITQGELRWISVGDSRVYLYRAGQINQLSRDHDLLQEWMGQILAGKRSMAEAMEDPEGRKLTSFIGMGELRYVDTCHTPIPLLPGDRVLLMSDGIYGSVSDAELQAILAGSSDVQEAAAQVGQRIRALATPYQDNYTLVILGYDPAD